MSAQRGRSAVARGSARSRVTSPTTLTSSGGCASSGRTDLFLAASFGGSAEGISLYLHSFRCPAARHADVPRAAAVFRPATRATEPVSVGVSGKVAQLSEAPGPNHALSLLVELP